MPHKQRPVLVEALIVVCDDARQDPLINGRCHLHRIKVHPRQTGPRQAGLPCLPCHAQPRQPQTYKAPQATKVQDALRLVNRTDPGLSRLDHVGSVADRAARVLARQPNSIHNPTVSGRWRQNRLGASSVLDTASRWSSPRCTTHGRGASWQEFGRLCNFERFCSFSKSHPLRIKPSKVPTACISNHK